MKHTLVYMLIAGLCSLMTACVAAPEKPEKGSTMRDLAKKENASAEAIKQRQEQQYAQLLENLQRRSSTQEARNAIARRDYYMMAYYAGRGGLKIPGVNSNQTRCRIQQLDGMGDMIYGDNHMKYRLAMRDFASQFNRIMQSHCR